jgi:hypothetical protein
MSSDATIYEALQELPKAPTALLLEALAESAIFTDNILNELKRRGFTPRNTFVRSQS